MKALRRVWSHRWVTNATTALVAGLGGLSLGVGGNALYGIFSGLLSGNNKANGTNLQVAVGALVAAAVFAWILVPLLRRVFAPRFPGQQSAHFTQAVPRRRALIALVSLPRQDGGNPAETAMLYHVQRRDAGGEQLGHCWLLYTPAGVSEVQRLREGHPDLSCYDVPLDAGAVQDPRFTYRAVRGAFEATQALGLRPEQVIADATGGTKPMTIGMALACHELGVSMEYISSPFANNRPVLDEARVIEMDMSGTNGREEVRAQQAPVASGRSPGMTSS